MIHEFIIPAIVAVVAGVVLWLLEGLKEWPVKKRLLVTIPIVLLALVVTWWLLRPPKQPSTLIPHQAVQSATAPTDSGKSPAPAVPKPDVKAKAQRKPRADNSGSVNGNIKQGPCSTLQIGGHDNHASAANCGSGGPVQQSNSGGINVQQATTGENSPIINSPITIGTVPKRISPEDLSTLTQFLASATNKAHISIGVDQASTAVDFAGDLYKVFKDAAWPMKEEGPREFIAFAAPGQKKFQGVIVTTKGKPLIPNETVYLQPSDPMYYVAKVIDALKLEHILERDENEADDLIILTIQNLPN